MGELSLKHSIRDHLIWLQEAAAEPYNVLAENAPDTAASGLMVAYRELSRILQTYQKRELSQDVWLIDDNGLLHWDGEVWVKTHTCDPEDHPRLVCPICKGPTEHDRCYPPNPYICDDCEAKSRAESGTIESSPTEPPEEPALDSHTKGGQDSSDGKDPQ